MKIGKELKDYWVMSLAGETLTKGYDLEIPWLQGEFAVTHNLGNNKTWRVTELTTGTQLHDIRENSPRKAANQLKNYYGPEHPCWNHFEKRCQDFITKYGKRDKI